MDIHLMNGFKEVSDAINNFVLQFDCEAFVAPDFYCDINSNSIFYSLLVPENGAKEFMDSINQHNPIITMDIFLWSLLHEIFHVMTYDDLTDEELDYCAHIKDLINKGEVDPEEYYKLPIEYLATEQAVKYANTHINELANFWNELQPLLFRFYELNDIH